MSRAQLQWLISYRHKTKDHTWNSCSRHVVVLHSAKIHLNKTCKLFEDVLPFKSQPLHQTIKNNHLKQNPACSAKEITRYQFRLTFHKMEKDTTSFCQYSKLSGNIVT
jgi:hypothetical protein